MNDETEEIKRDSIRMLLIVAAVFIGLYLFAYFSFPANAHDYHTKVVEKTIKQESVDQAIAIAAGQHHYKATNQLQWSVGGGHIHDDTAFSFGLGKQFGKVFISGNVTSDGTTSAIGFSGSGTF